MKVYAAVLMATASDRERTNTPMGRQIRAVVAVRSRAAAAKAFDVTPYFMSQYGGETGNVQEVAVAMARPGTVFIRGLDDYHGEYVERAR